MPVSGELTGRSDRIRRRARELDGFAAEAATLALGEPAPDAEALVVGERVVEALGTDFAALADALGLAGRSALLGEERFGVGLGAERIRLPGEGFVLGGADAGNPEEYGVDESVARNRGGGGIRHLHFSPFPKTVASTDASNHYTGVIR